MSFKAVGRGIKERARQSFTVPATSGDYANEVITIGAVPSGVPPTDFAGVTILLEGAGTVNDPLKNVVVELWLPRVEASDKAQSQMTSADYYHSGQVVVPVGVAFTGVGVTSSFGSLTYALSGYPGAQIRVKSGGTAGSCVVSVSAF